MIIENMNIVNDDYIMIERPIDMYLLEYQHTLFSEELNQIILEQLEIESLYILHSIENNVVTEGIISKTGGFIKDKITALIEAIKNFFSNLIARITKNLDKIIEINEKFLKNNWKKINKVNWADAKINLRPYWECSGDKRDNVINTIIGWINSDEFEKDNKNKDNESFDIDPFFKEKCKSKGYAKDDMDLKDSFEHYFITADLNKSADKNEYFGDAVKDKVINTFYPYVKNFKNNILNRLRQEESNIKNKLSNLEREAREHSVSEENYCYIEDTTWGDILTENNQFMLLELSNRLKKKAAKRAAEKASKSNSAVASGGTSSETKSNSNSDNGAASGGNDSSNDNSDNKDGEEKTPTASGGRTDDATKYKYLVNATKTAQLAIGASINVAVEAYKTYMEIIKWFCK